MRRGLVHRLNFRLAHNHTAGFNRENLMSLMAVGILVLVAGAGVFGVATYFISKK